MKLGKKIAAALLLLAVTFNCLSAATMEVQAAPKTTTYVLDSKKGVYYPTKVRAGINELYNDSYIYMVNEGEYVASVKSNSSNLIAKVTEKRNYTGDNYTSIWLEGDKRLNFKSVGGISYHAKKKGTYTLTVTIKNAKKKTTCKKKIKVYAEEYAIPVKTLKYAGKACDTYGGNLVNKKSGKIQVTMNKGFKLQKIEMGTYKAAYNEYSPEPVYVKIKNKQNIALATSTKYTANAYSYTSDYYSYQLGTNYDYLYPVTFIRITYKDTKLGIVQSTTYDLFYKDK
ncbi:MAG: hypothetical protein NC412_05235 [Roseburia sp.]|nr:hypothetical protein [Roseburia sp.]MCM1277582.1 hypothetical protein [Robinsoniella sp.]